MPEEGLEPPTRGIGFPSTAAAVREFVDPVDTDVDTTAIGRRSGQST
jgi:hypothetical protein